MTYRKKLIEVALPLEAINQESAREKSIRHGHPSTLHLWWARRPLAACRAVLFASLVDDPSSHPDKFPTEEEQEKERQRLHDLIGRIVIFEENGKTKQVVQGLVSWDDIKNTKVIEAAQREIARSIAWNRGEEPPTKAEEVQEYLRQYAPPVYDPFCGGGSIPLEAQRLGLEAHGSDLNPVAVLITKALIEIPPKFKDMPPVNPEAQKQLKTSRWYGAQGLAEDVRYYGKWMRDEAEKRIGHLYPKVVIPPSPPNYGNTPTPTLPHQGGGSKNRGGEDAETLTPQPLSPLGRGAGGEGKEATVIAWLWARTVKCPNPACGAQMPLVTSFELSKKKEKKAWVEPVIDHSQNPPIMRFEVKTGEGKPPEPPKTGRGAKFRCLACGQPSDEKYVKAEGMADRMGAKLMAIVAEGAKGRIYLSPAKEQEAIAVSAQPQERPTQALADDPRSIWCVAYGLNTFDKLFTPRQLVALTTFSNLVSEAREQVRRDALKNGMLICLIFSISGYVVQ